MKRIAIYFVLLLMASCTVGYSLKSPLTTGDAKTVAVSNFATIGGTQAPPTYSQSLTEALKTRIISETNLNLISGVADIEFTGKIVEYRVQSLANNSNDDASQSKLTVKVAVTYINNVDPTQGYDKSISQFVQFDANADFNSIEDELITQINDQITQDIIQQALGGW